MDLTPYVDHLRGELTVAAEAAGDDARALAERLTAPLESAVRLMLLDALSAAADEITGELAPGSVELRLRTGAPEFVVTPAPVESAGGDEPADEPPVPDTADGATARINLRLPEKLKTSAEQAAAREGLSVNAWLVRAVAAAAARPASRGGSGPRHRGPGQSYTGWVR
jgi:HicB-like protein involved in pilus formation